MDFDKTRPAALAEQMTALRVSVQKTRMALQSTRYEFPTGT